MSQNQTNIERAFQSMPRLLGVNNFMNTQPMQGMGMPQQQMMGNTGQFMNTFQGGNTMQFQQFNQHQMYQQQQMQQQQQLFNMRATNQTLRLNQTAYQQGQSQPQFMKMDPRSMGQTYDGNLESTDRDKIKDDDLKKTIPKGLMKDSAKDKKNAQQSLFRKKKKDGESDDEEEDPNAKSYVLELSIDESEYSHEIPLCQKEPERCALEFYEQEQLEIKKQKAKEEIKEAEAVYRKIGRKQAEVNELLFNAEEVKRQQKQTQDFMENVLDQKIESLKTQADKFIGELKDADDALADIEKDTKDMNDIVERIKYQRQADRIMERIDKAIEMDEEDVKEEKTLELYKDMTTAEMNEKLEKMFEKNQDVYGKVSELLREVNQENAYKNLEQENSLDDLDDEVYQNYDPEMYEKIKENEQKYGDLNSNFNKIDKHLQHIKNDKYKNKPKDQYYNRNTNRDKKPVTQKQGLLKQSNGSKTGTTQKKIHIPQSKGFQQRPLYTSYK